MRSLRPLSCSLLIALLSIPASGGRTAWASPKRVASARPGTSERAAAKPAKQTRGRRSQAKAKTKAKAKPAAKRQRKDRFPPMRLVHANTREKLSVRLYDRQGNTSKTGVRKLTHFLRCHSTGKRHTMSWRLLRNLYRISQRYKGKTIVVYSGFRARKVSSSRTSRHVRGLAIDLHVEGVSNRQLRDYLMASFKPCGVGYYPKGPFVHFDMRQDRSAFWVDYSGKGEPAEYAQDPYAVLKQERAGGQLPAQDSQQPVRAVGTAVAAQTSPAGGQSAPAEAVAAQPASAAPALPVFQPDIPPLGTLDGAAARGAAKHPHYPPLSSSGRSNAARGPFSSALRPLAGQRVSIAP